MDAKEQAEISKTQIAGLPIISINEAREANGQERLDTPEADDILLPSSGGYIPLSKISEEGQKDPAEGGKDEQGDKKAGEGKKDRDGKEGKA
jgi:hypothetical protein